MAQMAEVRIRDFDETKALVVAATDAAGALRHAADNLGKDNVYREEWLRARAESLEAALRVFTPKEGES